jgi:hypothetical protein
VSRSSVKEAPAKPARSGSSASGKASSSSSRSSSSKVLKTSARGELKSGSAVLPKPAPKKKVEVSDEPFSRGPSLFERLKQFAFGRRRDADPSVLQDPSRPRRSSKSSVADAAPLLVALKSMLDRDPRSRRVLVHLALIEKTLKRHGLHGLERVPASVLHRALSQLETLVSDWSEGSLAALRAQLKSALSKPGERDPRRARSTRPADLHESRLEINEEGSVSVFMEARAQWERSMTGRR